MDVRFHPALQNRAEALDFDSIEVRWAHPIRTGLIMGRDRGEYRGSPPWSKVPEGSEVPLVMGGWEGSTKAPPTRDPAGVTGAGRPAGVACHRRSPSGGGPGVSGPAHRTGAGRLDAWMRRYAGGCNGGGTLPLPRLCCSTTHILQPFLSGNIWRT